MNGPISKGVSSAFPRVFSRRSAILKIVEEKALGTRSLSYVYTSGSGKKRTQTSTQAIKETEMGFTKSLEESMKRRATCQTVQQDDDDLFGRLLASQLRQLSGHQKIMVKMKIINNYSLKSR